MAWRPPRGYGVYVEGTNSHEEPKSPNAGDLEALIASAEGLVESLSVQIARECGDVVPREDLMGYGHQGLLEAALRFDSKKGSSFRTFAYYRVRGAMIDGVRKMGPLTRRGFEKVALIRAAHQASSDLNDTSSEPCKLSQEEALDQLRKQTAAMVAAMTAGIVCAGPWFRSTCGTEFTPEGFAQTLGTNEVLTAEEQLEKSELHRMLHTTLAELPPPEDEVVRRFYVEGHNMDAIAHDLGKSRSWVSRVHTRALSRMGARLRF